MPAQKIMAALLLGFTFSMLCSACGDMKGRTGADSLKVIPAGAFTDKRGQAKIRLFTYVGEPEYEDIKAYAETLGCGMMYAYFYSAGTPAGEIPAVELQEAKSFTQAQEILFQGAGYAKWDYGAQCIGFIPTVTDCRETALSQNCR